MPNSIMRNNNLKLSSKQNKILKYLECVVLISCVNDERVSDTIAFKCALFKHCTNNVCIYIVFNKTIFFMSIFIV